MTNYSIGLSGLTAAQRAFEAIGNNIANAATEGYHRQRLELSPAFSQNPGSTVFIGGVNVEGITRIIDTLLEQELLRQRSVLASLSQETSALGTIEAAFGEFADEESGLNAAMDNFFTSLQNLSAHPSESIWQNQTVSAAQTLAGQFRYLGQMLTDMKSRLKFQAETCADTINLLTSQVAELNSQIERIKMVGGDANSISDQRDRYIARLAELIAVETIERENGVIDVSSGGLPLVTGASANRIEAGYADTGRLGISILGASTYTTAIEGGTVGGLLTLHNRIVAGIQEDLNCLANSIIQQINQYHAAGIGSAGSFTELSGISLKSDQLSDIGCVTDGTFYIRLTNTVSGQVSRHAITVNAASGTLNDVAASISLIPGLRASVNSLNQLWIQADSNYTFDFLPGALPEPTMVSFADVSAPSVAVAGIYTGTENDTLRFTVRGDGSVGSGSLQLEVRSRDGSGDLLTVLNIGAGYAAGKPLELGNGLTVALSVGSLSESSGDSFSIDVLADSDSSGFLAAAGLNVFFTGTSAADMAVSRRIEANPRQIAVSLGADGHDNINSLRLAAVRDKTFSRLDSLTCSDFYRKMAAGIGEELSVRQTQQTTAETVLLDLTNRQSEISGVDINEQAAELLIFEQMFQAMAQYLNTIKTSLSNLMDIL
ncbi:MAG TPA: flagellar hook-associated protein FlgK [Anaerohalosphaeraceae bacterium]|nr:flagellar hook-associated protein FlgK [Anaerohalosphaeraceae bacterium]HOL30774.1 flagellar hook-associated protein FlgK [Anaerohalosphaeraceae bacterium]HOM75411.1 flagellar hook-associated protein FlgK [Anaerohalosphaeraceae bacterium]HPC63029.1 flagellar hook-associated protein FlgK [Anaerohalosphaeraceae bacterium]HPO69228.1 flagellar hook-associated protein FlgK [Anaerohalosphaeraceae bacterium]